ncbi:MAG TPA: hypothetical protein VNW92_03630, partial [Polyangiaceae bacterium]|nr:hypothetical protein [Polyangiaceae bacterium]
IQTLGYLPLNVMQNRLVKYKIVGGSQRFRSARDFDPMATAMSALARTGEAELAAGQTAPSADFVKKTRSLRVVGG